MAFLGVFLANNIFSWQSFGTFWKFKFDTKLSLPWILKRFKTKRKFCVISTFLNLIEFQHNHGIQICQIVSDITSEERSFEMLFEIRSLFEIIESCIISFNEGTVCLIIFIFYRLLTTFFKSHNSFIMEKWPVSEQF